MDAYQELRLAVDNKWKAVEQLKIMERRLKRADNNGGARRIAHLRRELEAIPV